MKLRLLALLFLSIFFLMGCSDPEAKQEETSAVDKTEASALAEKSEPVKVEEVAKVEAPAPAPVEKTEPEKVEAAAPAPIEKVAEVAKEETAAASTEGSGVVHEVKMLNSNADGTMVFEPGFLKINKGDTVNFVATDAGHNAVGTFTPGEAWEVGFSGGKVTFNDEGVNIYYCAPHKIMAMYGIIQVGEAVNKDDAMAKVEEIEGTFVMNQGRLKGYAANIK